MHQGEAFASFVQSDLNVKVAGGIDLFQNYPKISKSNAGGWSTIPSDTKTCLSLKYCQRDTAESGGVEDSQPNVTAKTGFDFGQTIDPVTFRWNHPMIPLESLHVAMRVAVPSAVITNFTSANSSSHRSATASDEDANIHPDKPHERDYRVGHCSFGLNRLCQTATANALSQESKRIEDGLVKSDNDVENIARDISTSISVASILVKDGCPLYNIDNHSMQVCKSFY